MKSEKDNACLISLNLKKRFEMKKIKEEEARIVTKVAKRQKELNQLLRLRLFRLPA